ncbi:putative low molecular weight protein-tyrosine-phosphatase slr0328 [Oryza brachyantha]|uniref:putative low molecular weight protein-tyrosine-phosphatase slr0328 n=1 Tax=Oryza brachyantha TaxID=4533 RepID=UPI0003EAB627|nr:putative low molecular weight protein-tyrosine-phosphatase slr0328 [Oryza brachyantha]
MAGAVVAASSTACSSPGPNPTGRDPVRRRVQAPVPRPPLVAAAASRRRHASALLSTVSSGLAQARPRDPFLNPRLRFAAAAAAAEEMAAEASAAGEEAKAKPFSVLFVCLGNICRSPAAEAVFRNLVSKRRLDSKFLIDSAGTIGYHEGNKADSRMRSASKKRGIEVTSISRPVKPSDFRDFDLILAMDRQNYEDLLSSFERWRHREPLPDSAPKKVKLICSYCKRHTESEVPDPYYGGPQGFEKVLDLLEDACESLLDNILAENADISA